MNTKNRGETSYEILPYVIIVQDKKTGNRFEKNFVSPFLAKKFKDKLRFSKKLQYIGEVKNI